MATYLHPGVYIEEIPSGAKPIEGVATSVAAFVGPAPKGPAGEANLIQKLDDYKQDYGDIASEDDAMGLAVQAFYLNGGKAAYICRLAGNGSESARGSVHGGGAVGSGNTTQSVLNIEATSVGEWGNEVYYKIVKPDQDALTFDLEVGHREAGKFVTDEPYSGLSMRADDSNYALTQVNGNSRQIVLSLGAAAVIGGTAEQYQAATITGGQVSASNLAAITFPQSLVLNINGMGWQQITINPTSSSGVDIADAIRREVNRLSAANAYQEFRCRFASNRFVLEVPESDSNASLEINPRNELAQALHLDTNARATFTGTGIGTGGDLADNEYFRDNVWISLTLNIDGLGDRTMILAEAGIRLFGTANQADGNAVALAIQEAVHALDSAVPAYADFTCSYTGNAFTLTSGTGAGGSVAITEGTLAIALGLVDGTASDGSYMGAELSNAAAYFVNAFSLQLILNIDDHGDQTITLNTLDIGLAGTDNQTDGEAVALAIQNAVQAIDPNIPGYKEFACEYDSSGPAFTLTSGSASSRVSSVVVTDVTGGTLRATLGLDSETSAPGRTVEQGTARVIPLSTLGLHEQGEQLTGGTENPPTANDYADFYGTVLRKVRDVSIIVLPGQYWAADGSGNAFISRTLAHAEAMKSRMVIIDPPPDLELDQGETVDGMSLPTSTYSVLYYPWVQMANPFFDAEKPPTAARTLAVQPSAFAAGMWSKIDAKRGVWKAPAGVETQLLGAARLQFIVEDGEQDYLNPFGVNCIRKQPGFGQVFWGSRTLSTKAAPEWRYVPVRRTAIFIEQSIYHGIQWAVFEPNDHPLWSSLRANIGAFMNGLFRAGTFQGATAKDAYFVRCGLGDTMTQADIDRGQVIVIVGFAPLKPAEFVIVRIQQKVAQQ